MHNTDLRLNSLSCDILGALIGHRLLSIDAVIVARDNMSWNTVRLHARGHDLDIHNDLEAIVVDEYGASDEFGIMRVRPAEPMTLYIPEASSDTTTFDINEDVEAILIANATIKVFGDNTLVAMAAYPQAIAIKLSSEWVVLDKECWFSEMIAIKRGDALEDLIYDDAPNWEDDPDDPSTHYEYSVELTNL